MLARPILSNAFTFGFVMTPVFCSSPLAPHLPSLALAPMHSFPTDSISLLLRTSVPLEMDMIRDLANGTTSSGENSVVVKSSPGSEKMPTEAKPTTGTETVSALECPPGM
jgi:hypothetical protein